METLCTQLSTLCTLTYSDFKSTSGKRIHDLWICWLNQLGQYGQPIELIIIRYQFTQNQDTDTYTVHKNYDYTLNYIDIEGSMFRNITYSNRRNFLLFYLSSLEPNTQYWIGMAVITTNGSSKVFAFNGTLTSGTWKWHSVNSGTIALSRTLYVSWGKMR